jgi:hypothetical protein
MRRRDFIGLRCVFASGGAPGMNDFNASSQLLTLRRDMVPTGLATVIFRQRRHRRDDDPLG